jgi:hypothetical protein
MFHVHEIDEAKKDNRSCHVRLVKCGNCTIVMENQRNKRTESWLATPWEKRGWEAEKYSV